MTAEVEDWVGEETEVKEVAAKAAVAAAMGAAAKVEKAGVEKAAVEGLGAAAVEAMVAVAMAAQEEMATVEVKGMGVAVRVAAVRVAAVRVVEDLVAKEAEVKEAEAPAEVAKEAAAVEDLVAKEAAVQEAEAPAEAVQEVPAEAETAGAPPPKRPRPSARAPASAWYRRAAAEAPCAPPTPARVDARRKKLAVPPCSPRSVPAYVRVGHACAGARGEQGRGGRTAGCGAAARLAVSPRGPAEKF